MAREHEGKRIARYRSLYFDTPDAITYTMHHNRRLKRQKIRQRIYVDSNIAFLEIKNKKNTGRTKKKRIPVPVEQWGDIYSAQESSDFVRELVWVTDQPLAPRLENAFQRITLVNKAKTERITIDFGIRFHNCLSGCDADVSDLVIVEVKQDGSLPSKFKDFLRDARVKRKDESFVDFTDNHAGATLLKNDLLLANPHLTVVKSISKSYGVPGLRLGVVASGDIAKMEKIRKEVAIWNINSFAEFYMQIFNKYQKDYDDACDSFIRERNIFFEELKSIPFLRVIPSQANYFLCEITGRYTSAQLTERLLKEANILIKDCAGKSAFQKSNYIRIAIRDRNDNQALINKLREL